MRGGKRVLDNLEHFCEGGKRVLYNIKGSCRGGKRVLEILKGPKGSIMEQIKCRSKWFDRKC